MGAGDRSAARLDGAVLERLEVLISKALAGQRAHVYLFGSWARGDQRPGSDLDLAVHAPEPLPPGLLSRLREALEESTIPQPCGGRRTWPRRTWRSASACGGKASGGAPPRAPERRREDRGDAAGNRPEPVPQQGRTRRRHPALRVQLRGHLAEAIFARLAGHLATFEVWLEAMQDRWPAARAELRAGLDQ